MPPSLNQYTKSAQKGFSFYSSLNEDVMFLETVIFVKSGGFYWKANTLSDKIPALELNFSLTGSNVPFLHVRSMINYGGNAKHSGDLFAFVC